MPLIAATTVAALLIASPSTSDLDRLAANGGFLVGNAHRCGIEPERVVRAGQLIRELIAAAASGDNEQETATGRFASFFLVSAFPDQGKEKLVASCPLVSRELAELEGHSPGIEIGEGAGPRFRLSDGE